MAVLELLKDLVRNPHIAEKEFFVTDGRIGCPNALSGDEDVE